MMITPWNVDRISKNTDLILDGTDNMPSRYLINRYSIKHNIPYLYTAVREHYVNLSFINYPETPCLECFYTIKESGGEINPITESTVAVAASLEASEAINYLLRGESNLKGRLLVIDLKNPSYEYLNINFNPECNAHDGDYESLDYDYDLYFERDTLIFNPRDKVRLDLEPLVRELSSRYILTRRGRVGILFEDGKRKIGVTYSGNVIVKGVHDKEEGSILLEKLVNDIFYKYVVD
jgi:adenylyltransferase/sulfurtransferase